MSIGSYDTLKFVEPEKANFITHSGKFHADETMSTAILLMLRRKLTLDKNLPVPHAALEHLRGGRALNIARVDNATLESLQLGKDVLVYDIGGGEFDHHQLGRNGKRENGIYYSSVGLIWRKFGKILCSNERVWQRVDDELISVIDAGDNGQFPDVANGIPVLNISDIAEGFNPLWNENQDKARQDYCFLEAVDFMYGALDRTIRECEAIELARKEILEAIEKSQDGIMVLKNYLPWKSVLLDCGLRKAEEIRLVVYPSNRGGFYLEAVRGVDGKNKMLLPKEWRGRNGDLSSIVKGASFCHVSGFIGGADTLEHAVEMAKIAISKCA